MIGSSTFKRYGIYAIGETILIVLGILIALEISNWNESNQRIELERKTLLELRNELNVTRGEIKVDFDAHLSEIDEMQFVVDHLIQKKEESPGLWLNFMRSTRDHQIYPKSSAFENLKSKGLDIIRNDSLRREITQIYQLDLKRLVDQGDYNPKYDIEAVFAPYIQKYLDVDENLKDEMSIPGSESKMILYAGKFQNYDHFIRDRSLLREIQMQMLVRREKIQTHYYALKRLDRVVALIDGELNR